METKSVCVKVSNLRKMGYTDLEQWMNDKNNLYVGRKGRIWIHDTNGKRIFHYKGSKWQNKNTVKEHGIDMAMALYAQDLIDSYLIDELYILRGKNLGCFCDQDGQCHAKLLACAVNELY